MEHITTITPHLHFSSQKSCLHHDPAWAIVHACKDPCHRHAAGYDQKSLDKTHPHYLALERGHHLYLNLIDPPVPLFQIKSFEIFLDFVDRQISARPVLIHCNQGESRAPSLTLLYAAKRLGLFNDESFLLARKDFEKTYPYKPGKGIETFLTMHWHELGRRAEF